MRIIALILATTLAPSVAVAEDTVVFQTQERFGPAITYAPPKDHAETTVLNVLVRYHQDVRGGMSNSDWNAYLTGLFDTVNQIHANSGTKIEMNVAGSQIQGSLSVTNPNEEVLGQFAALADVEDWRLSLGAHLVLYLRNYQATHGACGAARLPVCGNDADCYAAASGYAVVSVDPAQCGDTGVMIAHQLAHNLGAAHEPSDPQEGTYPYAHAHLLAGGAGTLMSWGGATTRVPLFSSPDLDCGGEPCGIDGVSDNVRTLEETRHYVARWLTDRSITVSVPASVRADDSLNVDFSWFGVLGDTFDIGLYRNGTEVALLAKNHAIPNTVAARERNEGFATVAVPANLEPATDYTVRVIAAQAATVSGEASIEILAAAPKSIIQFAQSRVVADSSSASVAVQRQGDVSKQVSVDYATMGGSAHAGTNYTPVSGTLTWAAGETAAKSITVSDLRAAQSGNEVSVFIALSDPTEGAEIGTPPTAEIVIPAKAGGGSVGGGGGGGSLAPATLAFFALLILMSGWRRASARRTGIVAAN